MTEIIAWANQPGGADPVLRAAIGHLWFVTIHPFDDGNGRIARAIADWALAQSEKSAQRFYSMSAQIRQERNAYYDALEKAQRGTPDITDWRNGSWAALIALLTRPKPPWRRCFAKRGSGRTTRKPRSTHGNA
jgi:Fic family protein